MKVCYDPEVDILRITFSDAPVSESDEDKPGFVLDYDDRGLLVGIEVLEASKRVPNPASIEHDVRVSG